MEIQTILYPTDFSHCSKQALDHALYLAVEFGADLHMLHAVVLHEYDPNDPKRQFPELNEIGERLCKLAQSDLAQLARGARHTGLRIYEREERGFSAPEVILEYAEECDADLIVMGTHGRGGVGRFLLGSVAERVVRHASCPVLTLREQRELRPPDAIRNILAPVDFSEHAAAGLIRAKEIAARYNARVQVVHVVEASGYPPTYPESAVAEIIEKLKRHAAERLTTLVEEASGPAVDVDVTVLEGRAAQALLSFAEANESDLIVIPSQGPSGLDRVMLGSTAERILRRAQCPVLTLKPAEEG